MSVVRAQVSTFEKFISFGGLCSIIGVVGDLLTPVGNYTAYALLAGVVVLVVGCIAIPIIGFRSSITQTALMFGMMLTVISLFFVFNALGTEKGATAERFQWVAEAQKELLGLEEAVNRIVDNTENIARSSEAIAQNTSIAQQLNYSDEGFRSARSSLDEQTIALYCARGYRADHISEIFSDDRSGNREPARRFAILNSHECFDRTVLCNPENWSEMLQDLSPALDEARVEAVCGPEVRDTLRARKIEVEEAKTRADAEFAKREAEYEACEAQKRADRFAPVICIQPRRF